MKCHIRTENVVNEIKVQVEEGIRSDEQIGVRAHSIVILLASQSQSCEYIRTLRVARCGGARTGLFVRCVAVSHAQKGRRLNDVVNHTNAVTNLFLLGGQREYERVLLVLNVQVTHWHLLRSEIFQVLVVNVDLGHV